MAEQLSELRERIALAEQSTKAAHTRIDQMDRMMREDLKEMKSELKGDIKTITDDMKTVLAFLERGKGMIAICTVGAGFLAWIVQSILGIFFHK